jgi:hypothetical protein
MFPSFQASLSISSPSSYLLLNQTISPLPSFHSIYLSFQYIFLPLYLQSLNLFLSLLYVRLLPISPLCPSHSFPSTPMSFYTSLLLSPLCPSPPYLSLVSVSFLSFYAYVFLYVSPSLSFMSISSLSLPCVCLIPFLLRLCLSIRLSFSAPLSCLSCLLPKGLILYLKSDYCLSFSKRLG